MVHLLLDLDTATDLLDLAQRAGFGAVAGPLRQQLVTERLLPWDQPPALSVQYAGVSRDIFEDAIAEAMYDAMQRAYEATPAKSRPAVAADTRRSSRATSGARRVR